MHTEKPLLEKSSAAVVAAVVLAIAGLCVLALWPRPIPRPLPANAPPASFSAERAFIDIAMLARKPRPIGSDANAEARRYLLEHLRALGLDPQVQSATTQKTDIDRYGNAHVTLAVVSNIVARLPGNAPDHAQRPALLLSAHYDTAPQSLGAAAAAAPVAAVLETVRALRFHAPLPNDVIVLMLDGETGVKLGSRAFVEQHPWSHEVGMVLQFETGGSRGPMMLYETRGGDGNAVSAWARTAALPLGSSLMHELHGLNDGKALKQLGVTGLIFTNVEGAPDALGSLDTPQRLDHGTLQHMGETMLALTGQFGKQPLAQVASPDHVYFELPLVGLVHYSSTLIWPFTRLACLLFTGVFFLTLQRSQIAPRDVVNGALAYLLMGASMALAAYFVWLCFPWLHPAYKPLFEGAGKHDNWYLLAFMALASGLFVFLQRRLQEVIGLAAAALGALLAMTLLLLVTSALMPGASYLLTWPLFAALFAFAALHAGPGARMGQGGRIAILLAGVTPGVLLVVPLLRDVYLALTPERMNLPIGLLAILLGLGTVLLAAIRIRFMSRALVLASAGLLLVARAGAPYGEVPPQPNHLAYLKDAYSWKSYWLMPGHALDDWSVQYFKEQSAPRRLIETGDYDGPRQWVASAPRSDVAFPYIEVLKDDEGDTMRHIEFLLVSKNRAPAVELRIAGAHALRTEVNGRKLTTTTSNFWSMSLHGMRDQRMLFKMDLEPGKVFRILVEERIPGLPPHQAPPRAPDARPVFTPLTETTIASDTLVFR
ncbi:MAG: M28 family peptidase [Pseudomonadota bacterium]